MINAFPEKLRLVLKALSVTPARAAAGAGIDKGVLSRWLAGKVGPSAAGLERLSALIAEQAPGFQPQDWERDLAGLAALLGARTPPAQAPEALLGLSILPQAAAATARRGRAYEGFWRLLRPDDDDGFVYDYGWIRPGDNGLLRLSLSSGNSLAEGWLLILDNQLYLITAGTEAGAMAYGVLSAVSHAKVEAMDGLMLWVADGAPTARGVLAERVGDLTGDAQADAQTFARWRAAAPRPDTVAPELAAHLTPDFGPASAARGGELTLQMKRSHSLGRGAPLSASLAQARTASPPEPASAEDTGRFADKLSVALKALNLSGGQLASVVAADKSVVNRWLAGTALPSAYNLSRLTAAIAARAPGFSLLDWDRPPRALAERLGADLPVPARAPPILGLALPHWERLPEASASLGPAYAGVFRAVRPSLRSPDTLVEEYALIEPRPGGLPRFRLANFWASVDGWILAQGATTHFMACSAEHGVLVFGIFNETGADPVQAVEGVILTPSLDLNGSPTAIPTIGRRVADLSGDPAADGRRFAEMIGVRALALAESLEPDLRDALTREGGALARANGGERLLRMPANTRTP